MKESNAKKNKNKKSLLVKGIYIYIYEIYIRFVAFKGMVSNLQVKS
jgi:hypothetical protein